MNKPMPLSGVRADGEEFPIEASISRVVGVGHTLYMVILRDITERKRAERVQEVIHSISQAAVATENLQDLYRSIHQALGLLMPVENFYIALYDADTDLITFPYFVDKRDEAPPAKRPARGLTEYVLRTGRSLLATPTVFARLVQQGEVELVGVDSMDWLGVPLKIGTRIIGVMGVQSYTESVRFSLVETEILEVVSAQVATAIERKRAEAVLQQLSRAVEQSPASVVITNTVGRIEYVNPKFTRVTGYTLAEALDQNPRILKSGETSPEEYMRLWETITHGQEWYGEFHNKKKNGELYWESASISPIFDSGGNITHFVAVNEDITERKRTQEALQRYAARMEILHEIDRAILAAESLDEIAHATLSRMQHLVPSWHAQVVLFDLNSGEAFSVAAYENGNVAPFGRRVKLETLNLPESLWRGELSIIDDLTQLPLSSLRDQQLFSQGSRAHIDAPLMATGKVIGYLAFDSKQPNVFRGAVLDIVREVADQLAIAIQNAHLLGQTQIHAQELEVQAAALSRALDQQRELDRLQREFIQNVSHELRTPLSLVLGHAELLESNWLGNLQFEQQESIKVIARRARMLRKLVEDVIIVLEIENRELKQEPVNLARLVESLPVDFKTAAQAAGLTLNVEVAPDLPPLIGDEMALHRALDNLVGNALKFTPAGGHIDVRLSRSEQMLKLEVADSGVGIPSDQLPLIFNRFYQANGGTTRRFGGLGLGLALVKDVVDGHHGRIEVDSRVDEGTTFHIWLPLNGG